MNPRRCFSALAVALLMATAFGASSTAVASLGPPIRADARAVTHWNEVAATTLAAVPEASGGAPPALQINLGMTQGAVYDAVNAIGPARHQPYLLTARFGGRASTEAAVATAAYVVLTRIVATAPPFMTQMGLLTTLSMRYAASLGAIPGGIGEQQGIAVGRAAAEAMLDAREDDGRFRPSTWVRDPRPGHWSPLLDSHAHEILDPTPWVGGVEPFLIESSSQFRSAPPFTLDSAAYSAQVEEVQIFGKATNSMRTEAQTYLATWWQWAPVLAWNDVARQLITRNGFSAADAARLLALQNLSGADAAINCWNDKYHYDFWRPWNAIQRAGEDANVDTVAEPRWTPLLAEPYPEHPSGRDCLDGAHVAVLRAFFGDAVHGGFTLTSTSTTLASGPRERVFPAFSKPLAELIDARLWAGLNFRHASVEGQLLGARVAEYGAAHYFLPVGR